MKEFKLKEGEEFIPLCDLLKILDLVESGGEAKHRIAQGEVKVDGIIDTRKRRKVRSGELVEFLGQKIKVS